MLLTGNQIGVPQDLANFITLSDEHQNPLTRRFAKNGKGEIKSVLKEYQADVYPSPDRSNQPEGKDWSSFPGQINRGILKARIDRFDRTGSVSDLTEDVNKANGVASEIGRHVTQALVAMARDVECVIGSDQAAFEGTQETQNRTQGMGLWVQSGTTSQTYQTPSNVRPASAQIYTDTLANMNEDAINALLEAAWNATGDDGHIVGICGRKLKQRINTWPQYIPSSLSTQSSSYVTNRNDSSRSVERVVDRFAGDFGDVELEKSRWLAHENFGGTAAKGRWRGYFIHPAMWEWTWHTMPKASYLPFEGGNYKYGIYAYGMLKCLNPIGEIKIDPSDAS